MLLFFIIPICPVKQLHEVRKRQVFFSDVERKLWNTKVGFLNEACLLASLEEPWKRKLKCSHGEHSRTTSLIPLFQILALFSYFYHRSPHHITLTHTLKTAWHVEQLGILMQKQNNPPNPPNLDTPYLTKIDHRHKYKMQNYATSRSFQAPILLTHQRYFSL